MFRINRGVFRPGGGTGRRWGLKIPWGHSRLGSIPSPATPKEKSRFCISADGARNRCETIGESSCVRCAQVLTIEQEVDHADTSTGGLSIVRGPRGHV